MRKTRFPTSGLLCTGTLLLCALLTSACQGESANTAGPLADSTVTDPASLDNGPFAQVGDSTGLTGDALTAPEQPQLRIRAEAATLIFDWTAVAGQTTSRLYRYDAALSGEILVYESDDAQQHELHLSSRTARTPWHREQYRLELCTADDCVSSARVALSGLASATAQYLSPAVFLQGERYAEHLSVNHDASLAVISLPLEGALEFATRSGTQWSVSQRLRLDALHSSTTRSIHPSASASGDTVAVFIDNMDNATPDEIRILERLGEAWFQTESWSLKEDDDTRSSNATDTALLTDKTDLPGHDLWLSSAGDTLLLHRDDRLYTAHRSDSGWSVPRLQLDTEADAQASDTPLTVSASTVSSNASRAFTLVRHDDLTYLDIWTNIAGDGAWQQTGHLLLNEFSAAHELALQTNAQGDQLLVAGWEEGGNSVRYPILWHYALTEDATNDTLNLQALDSLRAPPTSLSPATLVFTADESLTLAVLGWQSTDEQGMADAAVSTWQYHASHRQWLSALELPEAIPTLAKQAFANGMLLSADGSTLMMTGHTRPGSASAPRINEVLILR